MIISAHDLEVFVTHYLGTGLWAEIEDETPLDDKYCVVDFVPEARAKAQADIEKFLSQLSPEALDEVLGDFELAGHDLWLTRNHHGAGFWDGDWEHGEELTQVAAKLGEAFIESDGEKIYLR